MAALRKPRVDLHQDAILCRFVWRLRNVGFEIFGLFISSDGLAFMLDALKAALAWWIGRHDGFSMFVGASCANSGLVF